MRIEDIIVICIGVLMIAFTVLRFYHITMMIKQWHKDKEEEYIRFSQIIEAIENHEEQEDKGVRYNSLKRNTVSIEMVDKDEIEKDFYMINIPDTPLDVETKDTTI